MRNITGSLCHFGGVLTYVNNPTRHRTHLSVRHTEQIDRGVRHGKKSRTHCEKSVRNQQKSELEIRNQSEIRSQKSNGQSVRRFQTP